jgi:hypothetical protein
MTHLYKLKDVVELNRMAFSERALGLNAYEVVRLMPADVTGEFSYRIKAGGSERAVRESEIRGLAVTAASAAVS